MKSPRRYRWADFFCFSRQSGPTGPIPKKPYRPKERVSVGDVTVMGEYNIMFLRNATGTTGSVGFPVNTVLVVKETPWLK